MKKILAIGLIFSTVSLFGIVPAPLAGAVVVAISAPSAVLLDTNSRLIYAKTPHLRRPAASTTKILTAMVVMDRLDPDEVVTIPRFAESVPPSKAFLRRGEKYRVRDLLRATLIGSANDAAEVLAAAAAGSRSRFVHLMNQKARALGCSRTRFVNPSGLPGGNQYSTAYDMALMMKAAQKYPFVVDTLRTRTITICNLRGREIPLRNHNKMLWRDRREIVGKTGWTRRARHCFVGQIAAFHKKVFVSMLGSRRLWGDLKALLDYQFGTSLGKRKSQQKVWSEHDIRRIQTALKRAGFNPGAVDGEYGPSTARAVRRFQRSQGLRATGVLGADTFRKLNRYA